MSKGSARGPAWEALRKEVLRRDPLCTYCKVNQSTQADHVIPRSKGGPDTLPNLRGACAPCNARKGARQLERTTYLNPRWLT